MSTETRDRTQILYGRRRIPRSHRRVMLVLLSGASNLSGYPISRTAMAGSGSVYSVLDRLEDLGWVIGEWRTVSVVAFGGGTTTFWTPAATGTGVQPDPLQASRRRFYRLTAIGRERVMQVLGLEEDR